MENVQATAHYYFGQRLGVSIAYFDSITRALISSSMSIFHIVPFGIKISDPTEDLD